MSLSDNAGEYVVSASKLAPSALVTGATAGGLGLQDWVYIVTIIYTVLMMAQLIYKFFKERNGS